MVHGLALSIALLVSANAGATTIDFPTVPTDTTYIDSGLLLGSNPSGYQIGACGTGQVGCLGDGGAFRGELTFTFVELGTTNRASTNMVQFLMCRECALRGSSAQVFDAFGALLTTIDMNTDQGVLNRTFSFSAANIGSVVVDLGNGTDGVESITFGPVSVVPEPGTFALVGLGMLGMAIRTRSTRQIRCCHMRNVARAFMAIFFALMVSNSASAIVSVTLTQVGGTYSVSNGGGSLQSDSLVLRIDYAITGGTLVSSIDVAISVANLATLSPGSSETGPALWEFGPVAAEPVGEPGADIASVAPGVIGGWEKQNADAWGTEGSCIYDIQPGGSCGTLGVISLHLTGVGGYIFTNALGHTVIMDGQGNDITASAKLGSFMLFPAPEPSTASLFGLGLVGLAAMKRRRSANRAQLSRTPT